MVNTESPANKIIITIARTIGISGLCLAMGLCSFGFGTFPSAEGHAAYSFGALLVVLGWLYERFGHLVGWGKK